MNRQTSLGDQINTTADMLDQMKLLAEKITDAGTLTGIHTKAQEKPMLTKDQAWIISIALSILILGIQFRASELSFFMFKLTILILYISYLSLSPKALESKLKGKLGSLIAFRVFSSSIVYSICSGSVMSFEFHIQSQRDDAMLSTILTMIICLFVRKNFDALKMYIVF